MLDTNFQVCVYGIIKFTAQAAKQGRAMNLGLKTLVHGLRIHLRKESYLRESMLQE